jgi:hypothetical protein
MQPNVAKPPSIIRGENNGEAIKKGRIIYIHIAQLLQLGTNNGQHKVMVSLWSL